MIIPILLITILFACFDLEQFRGERLGNLILLLVVGFPSLCPIHYVLSFRFKSPSNAFTACLLIFMVFGTSFLLTKQIITIPAFPEKTQAVGWDLHMVFMALMPHYTIADGVARLYTNYDNLQMCKGREQYCTKSDDVAGSSDVLHDTNYLAWNNAGIGKHLVFLVLFGQVFWFLVLIVLEGYSKRSSGMCSSGNKISPDPNEDQDVAAERQRVQAVAQRIKNNRGNAVNNGSTMEMVSAMDTNDYLVCDHITKTYSLMCRKNFTAVKELSFAVPKGECFGLLGVNGAGKTSTFRMLTKAVNMSAGSITVNSKSVSTEFGKVRRDIGYCPQYNGFVDSMTGREMLTMFAALRGLPPGSIATVTDELIEQLDLGQHADRYSGTYSGGNKRKLSTALALIGNPSLVYLDEPTSGMDPAARRFLWNVLASVTQAGKSIVLTSHSMEECEVLCHRLAIMKAGRFRCIGSTQHLKSRFGRDYTVIIKTSSDVTKTNQLKQEFKSKINDAKMVSDQNLELTYKVPEHHRLSKLFALLAGWKNQFELEDYSLSQTSLEQIFLQFAHEAEAAPSPNAATASDVFTCGICGYQGTREMCSSKGPHHKPTCSRFAPVFQRSA